MTDATPVTVLPTEVTTILEAMSDAFIALDRDGRFRYLNQHAAAWTGHPRETLIGRTLWDIFPRTATGVIHAAFDEARASGRPVQCDVTAESVNRRLRVRLHPTAAGVDLFITDISAEEALRVSRERHDFALNAAGVGLWYCDLPFDVLIWDDRVKEQFGLPPEARVTMDDFYALLHPDDRERARDAIDRAITERTTYDIDYRTTAPRNGQIRWIRAIGRAFYATDGTPIRFDGATIDITARKRVEEALRVTEARAQQLMNADIIGIMIADAERILEANDAFLKIVGYTRADLDAGILDWQTMTPAEFASANDRAFTQLREMGRTLPFEEEYIRKDGSRVPILTAATMLDDDSGQRLCFVLDITAQRDAERQKEQFLSAVTHDLRTPLTAIKGVTQLLLRRARRSDSPEMARMAPQLETIEAAAGRMEALTNELLDSARLRLGQPLGLDRQPTDLVALMRRVVTEEGTQAGRITIETAEPELIADIDALRFVRMFANLLSNALKYSPAGSPVTVTLARGMEDWGESAVLTVTDRGIGIPASELPHIFDRFFRGSNVASSIAGSGIGLAGTKQIIEQHGGTIAIESRESVGTRVIVRLPIAEQTAEID